MNRNAESYFAQIPQVSIGRSIFDRSSTHKTSFNVGDLIPIYIDEVLPGDTFKMITSKVVRLQTMLTPIMDNMYLDTYWFFVPNRLVWSHWKEFMGENNTSAWVQQTQYQIPSISAPSGGFNVGTIADYFGLPVGVTWSNLAEKRPSALPFRAYALIADSFFRDENLTDPLNIPTGDSNQTGSNGTSYINDVANGGAPFKVAKYHDYFTSALPQAQKSVNPVQFPLLSSSRAPVYSLSQLIPRPTSVGPGYIGMVMENDVFSNYQSQQFNGIDEDQQNGNWVMTDSTDQDFTDATTSAIYSPANLWADLSSSVGAVTVNQLRLAFQLQKFYEKQAMAGSRYIEVLKSHFGVTSPDARLQRPEYLGGNRISLAVHEVTNAAQSQQDFLGDLGAKSATSDVHMDFEHSFTEHGFLIGLCCARYDHSYPQGLEKMWSRRIFTDFYLPVFANLGNMPIYKCEIYANTQNLGEYQAPDIFGYQEAWAEYRYKPNRVSGEMRPGVTNSLASWHLADYYQSSPTLSDAWIREDKTNVDRVLAVTSANANQVFADFYFDCTATRAMPVYSVPGLIDHH